MTWLLFNLPSFVFAAVLVIAERSRRSGADDWRINLMAWLVNLAAAAFVYGMVARWNHISLIDGASLPTWLAIALFFIVNDLGEYVFHRLQHRIPLLWSMHSLHHSDPDISALTTMRHYWADPMFKTITVWSLAALIISPTPAALAAYFVVSLWHFVVHSRLPLNLGRWSWLINTPAYHRRHHSSDPAHFDSNFASLFPIWDVIMGDYNRPDGLPATGLETRPRTLGEVVLWPLYHRGPASAPGPEVSTRPA